MPHHVVVDGSNIATEGRSMPSLKQLHEAVLAFIAEQPDALITVVVDATFGHRIDPSEVPEFDEAVNNNELVAPPAGAVGRGDAFVLSIAHKVGATILTNDSFQEFHGQYPWLFDEGRLIGGKPVPHIGWVFVPRVPVRGTVSRKATQAAKRKGGGGAKRQASKEASLPMPVPSAPPPGAQLRPRGSAEAASAPSKGPSKVAAAKPPAPTPARGAPVNDLLPFLGFVEQHPVGSSVNAVVESYSSHGAYVRIGDVKGYIPLRLMADPVPRSARELMKIGDAVTVVVESFAPARRSIDLAIPTMATAKLVTAPSPTPRSPRKRTAKRAAAVTEAAGVAVEPAEAAEPLKPTRAAKPSTASKAATSAKPAPTSKVSKAAAPAPDEAGRPDPANELEATRTTKTTNASKPAKSSKARSVPAVAKEPEQPARAPVGASTAEPGVAKRPARRAKHVPAPVDPVPSLPLPAADEPVAALPKRTRKKAASSPAVEPFAAGVEGEAAAPQAPRRARRSRAGG